VFSKSEIVDVVLDPLLSAKMRKHQKDGVKVSMPSVSRGCVTDRPVHVLLRDGYDGFWRIRVHSGGRDGAG
jgi:hypothetical protein